MKNYEIEVKHDNGKLTIRVKARNIQQAKFAVMMAENCPESALGFWRVVPTKKQVNKTKRILAGM